MCAYAVYVGQSGWILTQSAQYSLPRSLLLIVAKMFSYYPETHVSGWMNVTECWSKQNVLKNSNLIEQ